MAKIAVATSKPEHRALVLDSFAHQYRETSYGHGVPFAVLIAKMRALLDDGWVTVVATPEGEPDNVLGFVVYRDFPRLQVAWLQVKAPYRRAHVATALWDTIAGPNQREIECAFIDSKVAKMVKQLFGQTLRFRPYLPDISAHRLAQIAKAADTMVEG